MSSGLWLPSKLVEELAEEKMRERLRLQQSGNPVTFHDTTLRIGNLPGSTGNAFQNEDLLKEIKGWIAIGIRSISDRISGLTLAAHVRTEDDDDDPVLPRAHPANQILVMPNPVFSFPAMMGLTAAWLKTTGEAYFQVLHDSLGIPRELWPMPPDRVFPVPSTTDVIGGYVAIGPNGVEIPLEAREVIRIWRPDPAQMYQAAGELATVAEEHNMERFRVGHVKSTFEHDATPRAVLEMDPEGVPPEPDEADAWREQWRELNHRRSGRGQGVPSILPPGFKLHEMGVNADGTSTAVLGDKARDQLLASMGVPGSIVGLVVDVNRSSADTNQFTFDKNTMLPLTLMFAGALTQQLAPQFDPRIMYQFGDFISPDKEFLQVQEASDLDRKVITPNEVRARRQLEPESWGDLPVGSFGDEPYTGEEGSGESIFDLGGDDDDKGKDEDRIVRPKNNREAPVTDVMRKGMTLKAAWARVIANERKFTATYARGMSKVFKTQAATVAKRLEAAMPEPRENPVPRYRVHTDDLFELGEWDELFAFNVDGVGEAVFRTNGKQTTAIVDPSQSFDFGETELRLLQAIQADSKIKVNRATKARIQKALIAGTAKGEGVSQLIPRITSAVVNRKRARTIARTEIAKVAQQAQLQSFRQAKLVERKQWNTSLDHGVRESHAATEGQVRDLDTPFRLGSGSSGMAPLDPALPPEDLVNCRCFMTAIFIGEETEED